METRRISENKKKAYGKETSEKTVVLPFKRRRRLRPIRALASLLLLIFFAVCVFTAGRRIGQEAASEEGRVGEFLIEQGMADLPSAYEK